MTADEELILNFQTMQKTLKRVLDSYKALSKSLEKLEKKDALLRQDYLADALNTIKNADLSIIGCADRKDILCKELEERLRTLRLNAHRALITGISERVANPSQMKIVSDNPLVIYVHPLTLEVQFDACKATWTYAHETLDTTSLDPDEIMAAHAARLDIFRASRIDSAQFFSLCRQAYEMAIIKNNLKSGDRVDLVELLNPLSWLWPNDLSSKKSLAPFPKYILAYQLQKLRADKLLQNNGYRIDLGAATGGTTRNKNNVLYIAHSSVEGQYYLSICFRKIS